MSNIWNIRQFSEEEENVRVQLSSELGISLVAAGLLLSRGVCNAEDAKAFIRPASQPIHDPFLMRDMDAAEARLSKAIESGEKILVYGDYDVDGTTAVALVWRFIHSFYNNLLFYIPDRYTEGYGISFRGIDYAKQEGCSLIIALDCGIKSVDKVAYASEKGVDFIICDHHKPGAELPHAVAVLNPHREDCTYPYTDLSGCGVGLKLMQAYAAKHDMSFDTCLRPLLPLLAMSIASDIVPMTGENRTLAFLGLQQMRKTTMAGLLALMQTSKTEQQSITISDLVFRFGPRVNACGRIYSGAEAVRLLITDDTKKAARLAREVEDYNSKRQGLDKSILDEAVQQIEQDEHDAEKCSTVVFSPGWHKGVVGIVASRLIEYRYRPTIVLTQDEASGLISGSARSVGNFDIYSAIDSCRDLLTNFGGHDYAAGLSMPAENLERFIQRFDDYVAKNIRQEQKQPILNIDAELSLADITPQLVRIVQCMEPFGPCNPRPVFVTKGVINYRYTRRVGKSGEHLHLNVTDRSSYDNGALAVFDGIAFGKGDMALHLQNGNPADICYTIEQHTFNQRTTTQLRVEDIRK